MKKTKTLTNYILEDRGIADKLGGMLGGFVGFESLIRQYNLPVLEFATQYDVNSHKVLHAMDCGLSMPAYMVIGAVAGTILGGAVGHAYELYRSQQVNCSEQKAVSCSDHIINQ